MNKKSATKERVEDSEGAVHVQRVVKHVKRPTLYHARDAEYATRDEWRTGAVARVPPTHLRKSFASPALHLLHPAPLLAWGS